MTPDKKAGVFAPREDTLLSDTRLCDTQAGFRKGWSTTDVLVRLRSRLQEKNTAALFVDFSRAFDSVDHSCILRCLAARKADPYLGACLP